MYFVYILLELSKELELKTEVNEYGCVTVIGIALTYYTNLPSLPQWSGSASTNAIPEIPFMLETGTLHVDSRFSICLDNVNCNGKPWNDVLEYAKGEQERDKRDATSRQTIKDDPNPGWSSGVVPSLRRQAYSPLRA